MASKERVQSKEEFAEEIREDVERIFTSYHSVEYSKETIEKGQLKEWESMSLSVAGGEQEIASALSDMYAPGFKTAFVSWLDSIRTYPKPIKFTLGRITELVDFKESDLFPQEDAEAKWGCEAKEADGSLILDEERNMYYYNTTVEIIKPGINVTVEWVIKRVYCPYLNRKQLTHEIQLRKKALETAVTVYLEEVLFTCCWETCCIHSIFNYPCLFRGLCQHDRFTCQQVLSVVTQTRKVAALCHSIGIET